jgi:hypothetical protein
MDIALGWAGTVGEWAIAIVIVGEIWVAITENRNARLFEAIKYIEDDKTRADRRIIYDKLRRAKPDKEDWWRYDEPLARAAADISARYNFLGAITQKDRKLRKFVVEEWANNICTSYEALESYIKYREDETQAGIPGSFRRYTALYKEALPYKGAQT